MIIYSVTVSLDADIAEDWLVWMQKVHIPEVMKSGCFLEYHIHRLLYPELEDESITYNVQYYCNSLGDYEKYKEKYSTALQTKHTDKFPDRFVAFRTLLERI